MYTRSSIACNRTPRCLHPHAVRECTEGSPLPTAPCSELKDPDCPLPMQQSSELKDPHCPLPIAVWQHTEGSPLPNARHSVAVY